MDACETKSTAPYPVTRRADEASPSRPGRSVNAYASLRNGNECSTETDRGTTVRVNPWLPPVEQGGGELNSSVRARSTPSTNRSNAEETV